MKVITNNIPRDLIYGFQLTDKEKSEFDYIEDIDEHSFVKYRGEIIDLNEFIAWNNPAMPQQWDGIRTDSFFSAVVIRYINDEQVVCGLCLS